jgi:ketosteroid isomerase-like protein
MNLSKPSIFFLFVALLAVSRVQTEGIDLEKAVGSLIAAERAYAKLAGEKGFREASISVFADDAVIFTPDAVNGKKFWQQTREDSVITWRPIFVSISRSGELGYTTGPSEYRKSRDTEKPDAFGEFVTIWQKNANGAWKVTLDVGLNHPLPQEAETEIRMYIPNAPFPDSESASANLERTQRKFAESIKDEEADAIMDHASDDIRVYRSGQLPFVGKKAAEKFLGKQNGETTRTPRGTGTSSPIDLAYEYGEYTSKGDDAKQRGMYLCIWRLESDGSWKIALDLQKTAPPEKQ